MSLYQVFKNLEIDFSVIGLEQNNFEIEYFCTPKGAHIIGSAGVDGIHYCFVEGQDEMVFTVNPMGVRYVMPIARNFEDLLRLLLACGSMDAIEQAYLWNEEQFLEYLKENQPTAEALLIFDHLRDKLDIIPMEQPFPYLRELQESYDYSQLNFSEEYYETIGYNPI